MGKRRFAQVPTSDEEDNVTPPSPSGNSNSDENRSQRKRKKVHIPEEDEKKEMKAKLSEQEKKKKKKIEETESEPEAASENEEQEDVEAQPLGEVIRVSGNGRGRKNHFSLFEYDGLQYELDITKTRGSLVMVTGQWFYHPEEAEKRGVEIGNHVIRGSYSIVSAEMMYLQNLSCTSV